MCPVPPAQTTELVADVEGERLDVFIARRMPDITRSRAQRLIDEGHVTADGARARPSLRLEPGQRVRVDVPPPAPATARPEDIPLDILYEDDDLVAVNKPAGMTVHPSPGYAASTLVNALLGRTGSLSVVGGVERPGIVHRLDRDTSGVILIARNDVAHQALARQLKQREIEKVYLALVEGTPKPPRGVIDAAIARDRRNRQRMAVVSGGRHAETAYAVIERFRGYALLEARPKTGRTHQIRVHLAAIGHPIVGDRIYGHPSPLIERQFLHAARIVFAHPRTGGRMDIEAPLPPDLRRAVEELRRP